MRGGVGRGRRSSGALRGDKGAPCGTFDLIPTNGPTASPRGRPWTTRCVYWSLCDQNSYRVEGEARMSTAPAHPPLDARRSARSGGPRRSAPGVLAPVQREIRLTRVQDPRALSDLVEHPDAALADGDRRSVAAQRRQPLGS